MPLKLWERYSRREVHDIFDPFSNFVPQRGTWGLQGIVKIPERSNDFVFFVTIGHKEGNFKFREGIDENGILTWQSQPKQKLTDHKIKQFINHDHLVNNIYLFLRSNKINPETKKSEPYTYLGRLGYIKHDPNQEQPVHFTWQLLDWDLEEMKTHTNIEIIPAAITSKENHLQENSLTVTDKPNNSPKKNNLPLSNASIVDFAEENEKKQELGLKGELLVFQTEVNFLNINKREDLAQKVFHTSKEEGDGAGYDILSWTLDGQKKYIEVKTTRGGIKTPYYMSANEIKYTQDNASKYYLYRLYEYCDKNNNAKAYIIHGDISKICSLTPTQYKII
ncbi:hypothetical protein GCM10011389_01280 [Pontibacillus salipaludis]|uniref:Protein NO VEIN C-terminal domain-containing protein n=2 Tax=Pontibacillus salipaludis TaxID=1697394 RepID=A0ABQ1PIL9_9BACI|nr:hypothetical protein GCM10011389_01280 [Pontibacillus salipaludis]